MSLIVLCPEYLIEVRTQVKVAQAQIDHERERRKENGGDVESLDFDLVELLNEAMTYLSEYGDGRFDVELRRPLFPTLWSFETEFIPRYTRCTISGGLNFYGAGIVEGNSFMRPVDIAPTNKPRWLSNT